MQVKSIVSALALAVPFLAACGSSAERERSSSSVSESSVSRDAAAQSLAADVQELKSSILAYAKIATENRLADETSIPASRLRMSSLIADLVKVAPAMPFDVKLKKTIGVWQEVWSDEQNPLPPGFKILRPDVFQVVREDGIGFNIGVRSTPAGTGTSLIQLEASADADKQLTNVVFTKTFFKPGDLSSEKSLTGLVQGILDGTRADVQALPEMRFPRGPVGAKGTLETVFVDGDLRIARGPNPYSGVVDTFILVRLAD